MKNKYYLDRGLEKTKDIKFLAKKMGWDVIRNFEYMTKKELVRQITGAREMIDEPKPGTELSYVGDKLRKAHKNSASDVERVVMHKCAACGIERPLNTMEVCMHNQMHRYVCDMKCMIKFYA